MIGPAPALIGKINDVYRYGIYLKNHDYEKLVELKDGIEQMRSLPQRQKALCQFDFDPVHSFRKSSADRCCLQSRKEQQTDNRE